MDSLNNIRLGLDIAGIIILVLIALFGVYLYHSHKDDNFRD